MSGQKLFSFGHGYSAQALEPFLAAQGNTIVGTTRNSEKASAMSARGVTSLLIDKDAIQAELETATHLLISASPTEEGDPMLTHHIEELRSAAPQLRWVGYLSTTAVYGDHGGAWVDEKTPVCPSTKRGELRADAERQWQEVCAELNLPLAIFRLAGIYGPGRGPFSKIRNGTARCIIKDGQVFSRIHVYDIAQTVLAAMNRPESSGIYNVCDDLPAPPEDVIAYAAKLLAMPVPKAERYETADMSAMARSFYAENKRVRNDKIKEDLGVQLRYPTYFAGLEALLDAMKD